MRDEYRHGDHNAICDRCGFKRKFSELKKEWTGLWVCEDTCWEARHPQDFVRAKADRQYVDVSRPEPDHVFLDPGDVTVGDL